jgi:putative cell wall-binding protein
LRDRIGAAFLIAVTLAVSVMVAPAPAQAGGQKVAIIVGPVGSMTDSYRSQADGVAAAAAALGATVVKVYSPKATWAKVRAAVNGANVIVYFGHGNGFPSPYSSTEGTDRVNGWGINRTETNGDGDNWSSTMVYCGEKALLGTLTSASTHQWNYCGGSTNTDGISPAPGFTMVYGQAHYTGGWGERYVRSDPRTTLTQAQQRVRNYSYPVLRLGANGFIATAYGDADDIVTRVLSRPDRPYREIVAAGIGYNAGEQRRMAHPDISGAEVWVQETVAWSMHFGEPDYWYAFAGDPDRTPSGATLTLPNHVTRYAGADRYGTAAAVSRASFDPGVSTAYVATGANFPDALAAGAAAADAGGPVLLVAPNAVPAATAAELDRLNPDVIKVVGGPSAVSDQVLESLRQYASGGTVHRVSGSNRFGTAAAISRDAFAPGVGTAYIATGANFPDALSGAAAAGASGAPILLARSSDIPAETATELDRLNPGRIVILGGTSVIGSGVQSALAQYATTGTVTRLAGADRYSTAAVVSSGTFRTASTVFIATGTNFPDALGGGPVAGGLPGPLLLVSGSGVTSAGAAELRRLDPSSVVVLGGTSVVGPGVVDQINMILGE